jgi:hypothetical protein
MAKVTRRDELDIRSQRLSNIGWADYDRNDPHGNTLVLGRHRRLPSKSPKVKTRSISILKAVCSHKGRDKQCPQLRCGPEGQHTQPTMDHQVMQLLIALKRSRKSRRSHMNPPDFLTRSRRLESRRMSRRDGNDLLLEEERESAENGQTWLVEEEFGEAKKVCGERNEIFSAAARGRGIRKAGAGRPSRF